MRDAVLRDRVRERPRDVLLPDEILERLRALLARENEVAHAPGATPSAAEPPEPRPPLGRRRDRPPRSRREWILRPCRAARRGRRREC